MDFMKKETEKLAEQLAAECQPWTREYLAEETPMTSNGFIGLTNDKECSNLESGPCKTIAISIKSDFCDKAKLHFGTLESLEELFDNMDGDYVYIILNSESEIRFKQTGKTGAAKSDS